MKLITFSHDGVLRLGALVQHAGRPQALDLNRAARSLPDDLISFLKQGRPALEQARQLVASFPPSACLDLDEIVLLAPIPRPGKIICVGLNYRDHAIEANLEIPAVPTVFSKYANAVIGSGAAILIPRVAKEVDFEAELAFVIGKTGRHIPADQAYEHIAGYTAFNDVSARDHQFLTSQWMIGKTFNTFAPMGPALVTTDEIPDPHDLDIRLRVGSQLMQSSHLSQLIFPIPDLVSYLSSIMTLEPGDVVSTGTPSGVGFARKPPVFLKPGDVVEVEIEGIGTLSNPVIAEP